MWSRQRLFLCLCLPIILALLYFTSKNHSAYTPFDNPAAPIITNKPVHAPVDKATQQPKHKAPSPPPPPPPPQSSSPPSPSPSPAAGRILKQAPDQRIEQGTDIEAEGDAIAFISRPDIKALKWTVEAHDEERIAPGYWFIAPIERIQHTRPGGAWIGPHIYDAKGDLIWSGSHLCNNSWVADFRKIDVEGKDMLAWHNQHTASAYVVDNHYRVVQTVLTGEAGQANTHEFLTVENGRHFLYLSRNDTHWNKAKSLRELGYDGRCNVSHSQIVETDVRTGEKLFTWNSEDHLEWTESTLANETIRRQCNHEWEYLHANAIDKFDNGDYLLSSRLADTLYRISKDDGSILWRLNGQGQHNGKSDFEMVNLNFSRQHDATIYEHNDTYALISILDNAKGNDEQNATSNWSRAMKIALRFDTMRAELVFSIDHPHHEHSFRRGNYMVLPNGNDFIGWSEHALQTEYTPEGDMVLEARLVTEILGTYRSFKYPWIGLPDYPPDIGISEDSVGGRLTLTVYASWNGATEVAEWILYETGPLDHTQVELMRAPRSGFETALQYDGVTRFIYVQACDRNGAPLEYGRSKTLETNMKPIP